MSSQTTIESPALFPLALQAWKDEWLSGAIREYINEVKETHSVEAKYDIPPG